MHASLLNWHTHTHRLTQICAPESENVPWYGARPLCRLPRPRHDKGSLIVLTRVFFPVCTHMEVPGSAAPVVRLRFQHKSRPFHFGACVQSRGPSAAFGVRAWDAPERKDMATASSVSHFSRFVLLYTHAHTPTHRDTKHSRVRSLNGKLHSSARVAASGVNNKHKWKWMVRRLCE